MTEIIQNIEEVYDVREGKYSVWEGYLVTTNKQTIKVLIDSGQFCCEEYGFFSIPEEDNLKDFIGSELLSVNIVDKALNTIKLEEEMIEEEEAIFVNLETSKGTLQLTVYNSHNGYYGHAIKIVSEQVTKECYL